MPNKESSEGSKAPIMRYGQGLSDSQSFEIYAGELENWLTKQKGPVEYLLEVPSVSLSATWNLRLDSILMQSRT